MFDHKNLEQFTITDMECSKCYKPFALNLQAISITDCKRQMMAMRKTVKCPDCEASITVRPFIGNNLSIGERNQWLKLAPQFKKTQWEKALAEKPIIPLFDFGLFNPESIGGGCWTIQAKNLNRFIVVHETKGVIYCL